MTDYISKSEFDEREWFYDLLAGKTKTDWGSRDWAGAPESDVQGDLEHILPK